MGTPSAYIIYKSKQQHPRRDVISAGLTGCLISAGSFKFGGHSSGDEEEMYDAK